MERIPLPAKAPGGKAAADGRVAAGGKAHRQSKAVPASAERERITAWPQEAKKDGSLTKQGPRLTAAAVPRLQEHFIHGTKIFDGQADAA